LRRRNCRTRRRDPGIQTRWISHPHYLKTAFNTPPLSLLLHIHGAVMSGWVILLVVQSSLIAAHYRAFHAGLYLTNTPTWIAFGSRLVS
jgi:hypothetical protein